MERTSPAVLAMEASEAEAREDEARQIATWIEAGPHEVQVDDATCRWLAVQIRLHAHRPPYRGRGEETSDDH